MLIPAKTFILGEYVALLGGPALLVTTQPCFEVTISATSGYHGVHPNAPAARFWEDKGHAQGLLWHDPYAGLGGMGASSAQFVAAFTFDAQLTNQQTTSEGLLKAYWEYASTRAGIPPSGYDVLAQTMSGCVFLHRLQDVIQNMDWPFLDIAFVLVHTEHKLATHTHLGELILPKALHELAALVLNAFKAMQHQDSKQFIECINDYAKALDALNLVTNITQQQIELLKRNPDILAIKGCGAMGADVLLCIVATHRLTDVCFDLKKRGRRVLATSAMHNGNRINQLSD